MQSFEFTSDGPISCNTGFTFRLDDQGGPQPPKPWKPGDKPYDPKEDKKEDEQEHPATA